MDKNYNFVKTSDEETANMLREAGFVELPKEQDRFVFLNDGSKFDFSKLGANISFDNKLMF